MCGQRHWILNHIDACAKHSADLSLLCVIEGGEPILTIQRPFPFTPPLFVGHPDGGVSLLMISDHPSHLLASRLAPTTNQQLPTPLVQRHTQSQLVGKY